MPEAGHPQESKFTVFTDVEVFKQIFEENGYTVNFYLKQDELGSSFRGKYGYAINCPNDVDEQLKLKNFNGIFHGIESTIAHYDGEVNYISLTMTDIFATNESLGPVTEIAFKTYG